MNTLSISRLLKSFFRSFLFYVDGDGEGAGGGDELDGIADLMTDEADEGEDGDKAGDQDGQQAHPEDAQADDPNDPTHTLTIDGEQRVVKQSELLAKAQKYLAGEKRLEEAATMRKQIEAEKQQIPQERQQLQQALQHYTTTLTTLMQQGQPDWGKLADENPAEYVRQRHAWDSRVADLQRAQEAQAILTQREQAEQATNHRARAAEEETKLLDALPEWKDPAKAKTEAAAVDGYLAKTGFSDQERNGISDHRLIVVARKAMLYDQLMASQTQATQRVKNVPPRAERPGAATQSRPGDVNRQKAEERFRKAPSIDTLAALLD